MSHEVLRPFLLWFKCRTKGLTGSVQTDTMKEVSDPAQPRAGVQCHSFNKEWLWQYPCEVQALGLEVWGLFFPLTIIKQCQA